MPKYLNVCQNLWNLKEIQHVLKGDLYFVFIQWTKIAYWIERENYYCTTKFIITIRIIVKTNTVYANYNIDKIKMYAICIIDE